MFEKYNEYLAVQYSSSGRKPAAFNTKLHRSLRLPKEQNLIAYSGKPTALVCPVSASKSQQGRLWKKAWNTGSDASAVKGICNYMTGHYRYSAQMPNGQYPEYAYSVECLLREDGVCSGFASGLTYLLRKLQIPVITVLGKVDGETYGGHAWNIVRYADGTYRHIDVTWDMGRDADCPKFFNMDDWAMRARGHFWCKKEYPVCG